MNNSKIRHGLKVVPVDLSRLGALRRGSLLRQWRIAVDKALRNGDETLVAYCREIGIANTELDKGGQLKAAGDILGAGGTLASAKEFVAVRWVRCGYALHE